MLSVPTLKKTLTARVVFVGLCLISCVAVGVAIYGVFHSREIANTFSLAVAHKETFPVVNEAQLSDRQKKIIQILRTEYEIQSAGTKYSEGANEPWCANFVSWVLRAAGTPLKNPNSGSWRIPGTFTLREYFVSNGVFHAYGDGYEPKTGDVAIYDGNGPFGQHTNFVVKYEQGNIYTVGGNEAGKIHAQVHPLDDTLKLVGFAEL